MVATLPKAVTGAINVRSSSFVQKGNFAMIIYSEWFSDFKNHEIISVFLFSIRSPLLDLPIKESDSVSQIVDATEFLLIGTRLPVCLQSYDGFDAVVSTLG